MSIELLAPAKDKETAFAAIDCGADAVYMGAPSFGARKNAPNSLEDIKEVVEYAHKYWARVHIALNTILNDNELEEAIELAYRLQEIGIDALIIQDMGLLLKLANKINENDGQRWTVPLHMSTQCNNYLPEKVKFFNDIGVTRVILARELSIAQIKKIHEENPNLEIECFIHGALCVSMSGQCYLSQSIGGRSANRGECAQPCRKKYDIVTDKGEVIAKDIYPLCLKDFNGSEHISELIDAGVCSFKIEGRLKDVGYVKNVVSYYRKIIAKGISSGKSIISFTPNPEKSFNRGFTDYFLKGRGECYSIDSPKSKGEYLGKVQEVGGKWFKIRTDKPLHPQDGLYFNGEGCLINEVVSSKSEKNSGEVIVYLNKNINIQVNDTVYRNQDIEFAKELLKPVKRQIAVHLEVLRANPLSENIITISATDEDGNNISISKEGEKAKNLKKAEETFIKQFSKTGNECFYIEKCDVLTQIPFMPVSAINELRRTIFSELVKKRIGVYNTEIKQKQGKIELRKYYTDEVDYRANIHNRAAKEFYEKCGVKVLEPSFENKQPERKVELMRCKHCIKYALNMCKSPKKLFLKDKYNKLYPLEFNCEKCEMSVIG